MWGQENLRLGLLAFGGLGCRDLEQRFGQARSLQRPVPKYHVPKAP